MNKKRGFAAVVLFPALAAATLLQAGDPWKDKPYTEWTAKETKRILTKSPWAKKADILLGMTQVGSGGGGGTYHITEHVYNPATGGHEDRITTVSEPNTSSYPITAPETMPTYVQWASSLTLRQAQVRQKQLELGLTSADETRILTDNPDVYVIRIQPVSMTNIIQLPSMRRFGSIDRDSIRTASFLEIKPGSRRVPVSEVVFIILPLPGHGRIQVAELVQAVELHFPRQVDGKPTILPTDREAVLHCAIGEDVFRVKFDLRKMMRDGKPDL